MFTDVPIGADQALNRGQSMHRLHNATVVFAAHDSDLESNERLAICLKDIWIAWTRTDCSNPL